MTEQEIMQLAKEAGFGVGEHNGDVYVLTPVYEDLSIAEYVIRFAILVAQHEREACLAEIETGIWLDKTTEEVLAEIATAIRARGEKGGAEC